MVQLNDPLASIHSSVEVSPSGVSYLPVHVELAVFAADHLVAEDGQLFVEVAAVEGEG